MHNDVDPAARLPMDVWAVIACHVRADDARCMSGVSKAWNHVINESGFDAALADAYATRVLKDGAFWQHALRRPALTSKPLRFFRLEIERIERARGLSAHPITAKTLYEMWRYLDA